MKSQEPLIRVMNLLQQAPIILDGELESKAIDFVFEPETEAEDSCSIIWQNQMYVFGGWTYQRQISLVDQCHLKRVGSLPFLLARGACTNFRNEEIFLCFNSNALVMLIKKFPSSTSIITQSINKNLNHLLKTKAIDVLSDISIASNESKFIYM